MNRVLVGMDRSQDAKTALCWAASIAGPLGAEVVAICAWEPQQAELSSHESENEHRDLREAVTAMLGELPDVRSTRCEVIDGAPVHTLLERADAENADLLVVGLRGAGGFPGLRVGSVTDALAHHTTRTLAVVPEASPLGVRRIVLGVDGSDGSVAAASWCASFASDLGAEVTAVSVFTQQYEIVPEQDPHSVFQYVQRALHDKWVAPLRDAGVTVHPELLRERHVAEALVNAAERVDAQMIVVGTHGFAPLIRMRLGGVAMRLLHTTPLPVVLVPPG